MINKWEFGRKEFKLSELPRTTSCQGTKSWELNDISRRLKHPRSLDVKPLRDSTKNTREAKFFVTHFKIINFFTLYFTLR